jgi:hypothetical protein
VEFQRVTDNDILNRKINELLAKLDPADVQAFVRAFRSNDGAQNFHSYRELIFGARLRDEGFNARYEQRVYAKTPDWSIYGSDDSLSEIVDVLTVQQRQGTAVEIGKAIAKGEIWTGWITIPPDHLWSKISEKSEKYSKIAVANNLPFCIAVFSEFTASIEAIEIHQVLHEEHGGLFTKSPWLSGVIFFREGRNGAEYDFTPYPNPLASWPSKLFSG